MPSAVIRNFSYESTERVLRVQFASSRGYAHHGVPVEVTDPMRDAYSSFAQCDPGWCMIAGLLPRSDLSIYTGVREPLRHGA
jgi:hypothetical protein